MTIVQWLQVATPKAMKCLEKLVMTDINSIIPNSSNPLQFAYRPNRAVDDAISLTLHIALEHLDRRDTNVQLCIQCHCSLQADPDTDGPRPGHPHL